MDQRLFSGRLGSKIGNLGSAKKDNPGFGLSARSGVQDTMPDVDTMSELGIRRIGAQDDNSSMGD